MLFNICIKNIFTEIKLVYTLVLFVLNKNQFVLEMSTGGEVVMEVPTSLKRLARLVVRGFYTIEDALIIDILVRNPCMKEDDMCELLKFERKMLRQRISILRSEKFLQTRLRMETGADSKAQKVNYYFINYKVIYF